MRIYFRNYFPIIKSKFLCEKLGKLMIGKDFGAISIFFPFIIVKNDEYLFNEEYILHESIHFYQILETLIIFYYIIYSLEYLYGRLILKLDKQSLYYYISFEQEAHRNDLNKDYLKKRKWFSSYKYLPDRNKKKIICINDKRVITDKVLSSKDV